MDLTFKVIKSEEELISFKYDWDELYHRSCSNDIYQSIEWILIWWKYYKTSNKIFCIIVYENQSLIAAIPFMITTLIKERFLNFIAAPFNDFNYILVDKRYEYKTVFYQVLEIIQREFGSQYDYLKLESLYLDNQDLLSVDLNSLGLKLSNLSYDMAPMITLPKSIKEYLIILTNKRVKKFEYYQRRLFNNDNKCSLKILTSINELNEFIKQFRYHKNNIWNKTNKFNVLMQELREDFFFDFLFDVMKELLPKNKVILPTLLYNNSLLASGVYFTHDNKISKYIQAWDYEYKALSPGTVLDWIMIKYAINNKYFYFDFGRGDEEYKYKLGAKNIILTNAIVDKNV